MSFNSISKFNLNITRLECKAAPPTPAPTAVPNLNITRLECKDYKFTDSTGGGDI